MELQTGTSLAMQQFKALGKKNMWLTGRNKKTIFLQMFIPFIFIAALFGTEKLLDMTTSADSKYKDEKDTEVTNLSDGIQPCESFSVRIPCYDFVWSGNTKPRLQRIIDGIMANNPGRIIPSEKVKSFATVVDTEAWLFDNPARCPGALHLFETNATVISYGLQINSTVATLNPLDTLMFHFEIPIQLAAEHEIAKTLVGDQNLTWNVGIRGFPHAAAKKPMQNIISSLGGFCFTLMTLFIFQNQLTSVVMEKELKLRQAMNIMGLYDSAYWLSWLAWEIVTISFVALDTLLFGLMFGFSFFTHNNYLLIFLLFFLYLLSMTSVALALSALINVASSATLITIITLIVSLAVQIGFLPLARKFKICNIIQKLLPPGPFHSALNLLVSATADPKAPGISWKGRKECPPLNPQCLYTIEKAFFQLLGHFFLWFAIALYLDNVVPSENGKPKPLYYFLTPGYWTGQGGNESSGSGLFSSARWAPKPDEVTPSDIDVLEEENSIKQQMNTGVVDENVAVQIRGLIKTYIGKFGAPPFHAIRGLWVNFPKDQLFCLLGHNGAGKSTTISCLTGTLSVSGGDALIYDNSIRSSVGMANIRRMIGVCPQFDILWNVLTGEEHLELFSNIKGLPSHSIPTITQKLLEDVQLAKSAKVRSGSYSGGMRRRLSVAAALLGDPKLVILDEPTTGMDPITRRHVWDIIESAKRGRSIVLTTHSMEEADVLSDRIGIMAKGRLRCVGTPIRMKMRFGTGFVANMSFSNKEDEATIAEAREAVKQFLKRQLDVTPTEETTGYLTFIIPHDKEPLLKRTFGEVQERQIEFCISDIQLGLATLEEVFLNVNKKAEMEEKAKEEKSDTSV